LLARSGQGALQSFQSHCFSSKSGKYWNPILSKECTPNSRPDTL
jgi:hypothetical protein